MADKFQPGPFNFCDYRCEKCDEQENCRVFKEDQERVLEHYTKGEDPNDPEVFIADLDMIFKHSREMIMKMAEEQGIDLAEAGVEDVPEVDPRIYVLYNLGQDYSERTRTLIKKLETEGIPEGIEEEYGDLVWYHTLILAKVARVVNGFDDEFDAEFQKTEEEGTLRVIAKGINLSRKALEKMVNELPGHLEEVTILQGQLTAIEHQIEVDRRARAKPDDRSA